MIQSANLTDLIIRMLVIACTSIILLLVTRDNNFDLHFKIRKAQPTLNQLLIVEIPNDFSVDRVISELQEKKTKHIFISHFLYDQHSPQVTPYIVGDKQNDFLSIDIKPDSDGLSRRVTFLQNIAPFDLSKLIGNLLTINFRGPANTFPTINYYDLSSQNTSLEGTTIIIKPTQPIETYTTPLGPLSEAEMLATIWDNFQNMRFIPPKGIGLPSFILFILLLVSTGFLIYLPSTLALLASAGLAIAYVSFSLWLFDLHAIWTPILTPTIQILITFLLISNYKFVLNEKTRWSLEKESLFFNQVEEMKTNFLSLFSHDLKTPLAKIIGITDTLKSKVDDEQMLLELEKIHQSSKDLDKYIKRILKMSQVQSRNIALSKEPTDINNLIKQSIEQNLYLAQEKNIHVLDKTTPLFMVEVDGPLIQEVIVNFIENAITYSPNNSEIIVLSEEINDFIKVSVRDNGPGIPKSIQDNIWEKSYRFDTEQAGYGLGLFLSRYVVHLHGGQVFLNSREKHGSEFGFLLPLTEDV